MRGVETHLKIARWFNIKFVYQISYLQIERTSNIRRGGIIIFVNI